MRRALAAIWRWVAQAAVDVFDFLYPPPPEPAEREPPKRGFEVINKSEG